MQRCTLPPSRAHVKRREGNGCNLSASDRWSAGIQQRRMSAAAKDQDDGKNDPSAPRALSCAVPIVSSELTPAGGCA